MRLATAKCEIHFDGAHVGLAFRRVSHTVEIFQSRSDIYPGYVINSTLSAERYNKRLFLATTTKRPHGDDVYSFSISVFPWHEDLIMINLYTLLFATEERNKTRKNEIVTIIENGRFIFPLF